MKSELVIWGAGGHAKVVADIVHQQELYTIAGFLDDVNPERKGSVLCGAPILGGSDRLDTLQASGIRHIFIAIGDCAVRSRLAGQVQTLGLQLATCVHPHAVVAPDVTIGCGTAIMAGVVVNAATQIGENVIINTASSIDHDCVVADGVHISPGAHLGGDVTVGQSSWIGIGAVIREKVQIGEGTVIGAGAVVLDDVPDGVVAFGLPARVRRKGI